MIYWTCPERQQNVFLHRTPAIFGQSGNRELELAARRQGLPRLWEKSRQVWKGGGHIKGTSLEAEMFPKPVPRPTSCPVSKQNPSSTTSPNQRSQVARGASPFAMEVSRAAQGAFREAPTTPRLDRVTVTEGQAACRVSQTPVPRGKNSASR